MSDLKGHKILGAGLNLNWMKEANIGIIPGDRRVAGLVREDQNRRRRRRHHVPQRLGAGFQALMKSASTTPSIGFGSITWHGLTVNQPLLEEPAAGSAADHPGSRHRYEIKTGEFNKIGYKKDMDWLRSHITVSDLPDSVRLEWAQKLSHWPQKIADELEAKGYPAKAILNATLDAAEKHGYKWPVRYVVK